MKVALINPPVVECGLAEYGRDLALELMKEFELSIYGSTREQLRDEKVVLINWHPARVDVNAQLVAVLKAGGARKVILIEQNYSGGPCHDFGNDITIGHEPMACEPPPIFRHIMHGIPEIDRLPPVKEERMLGIAGFPFPWKGYDTIVLAALEFGCKCRMIAPRSDQMNTESYFGQLVSQLGDKADVYRQWLPKSEVVRMLAECTANVFFFWGPGDDSGQSGSVRMGLAAKRPIITSAGRRCKTLFEYGDEIYICPTRDAVQLALKEILDNPEAAKKPNRILRDQSWSTTGEQYRKLIRELAA